MSKQEMSVLALEFDYLIKSGEITDIVDYMYEMGLNKEEQQEFVEYYEAI